MDLKSNSLIILIVCLLSVIFISELGKYINNNKLTKRGEITIGKITVIREDSGRMKSSSKYIYEHKGVKYNGVFSSYTTFCKRLTDKEQKELINSDVWVIYDPQNPSLSKIVTSESELKKYSEIVKKSPETSKIFFKHIQYN